MYAELGISLNRVCRAEIDGAAGDLKYREFATRVRAPLAFGMMAGHTVIYHPSCTVDRRPCDDVVVNFRFLTPMPHGSYIKRIKRTTRYVTGQYGVTCQRWLQIFHCIRNMLVSTIPVLPVGDYCLNGLFAHFG
jgi:hypothetical protein